MKIVKGFCTWLSENVGFTLTAVLLLGYMGLWIVYGYYVGDGGRVALDAVTKAHGASGFVAVFLIQVLAGVALTVAVGLAATLLSQWVQDKVDEWIADRAERFRAEARAAEEEARRRRER